MSALVAKTVLVASSNNADKTNNSNVAILSFHNGIPERNNYKSCNLISPYHILGMSPSNSSWCDRPFCEGVSLGLVTRLDIWMAWPG